MKKFIVSFNFVSEASLKEDRFCCLLKWEDIAFTNRETKSGLLLWRVSSTLNKIEPILNHIKLLISAINKDAFLENRVFFKEIYFDIGVIFDTANCSIDISAECLKIIHEFSPEIDIDITCYPSDE